MLLTLHTCNAILHLSAPSESSLEPSIEEGLATHVKSSSHSPKSTFDSRENTQRHIGTSHGTTWHLGGWILVGEDTASFNGNEKLQSFNGYVWRLPVTSIVEGLPGHRNTSVSIHRKTLSCCTTVWQRWDLGDVDHFLHKRQQTYPPTRVGVV